MAIPSEGGRPENKTVFQPEATSHHISNYVQQQVSRDAGTMAVFHWPHLAINVSPKWHFLRRVSVSVSPNGAISVCT